MLRCLERTREAAVLGLFAATMVLTACTSSASPEKTPAIDAGVAQERLQRISDVGEKFAASGYVPGLVFVVSRRGETMLFESYGVRGVADPTPIEKDDIFRIYSMTKPIAAVALMQLYEQGEFHLTDPVSKYVPELQNLGVYKDGEVSPSQRVMTMRHLVTHTSGLSHGIDPENPIDRQYIDSGLYQSEDLDEFAQKLGQIPLMFEPGSQWHYSVGMDVAGLIVERISGQTFEVYLQENLFAPLGMVDTSFHVPDEKLDRFLPLHYIDPETGALETFDKNNTEASSFNAVFKEGCRALCDYQDVTLFAGSGGLVSTASDYMRFAEMLRNGGELDGIRILSPKTIEYMTLDHLPALLDEGDMEQATIINAPSWFGFGLGFGIVNDPVEAGIIGSPGEYFWSGGTGPIFWVDPVEDIVVVGMIQVLSEWPPFHPDLKVAIYQSISELQD